MFNFNFNFSADQTLSSGQVTLGSPVAPDDQNYGGALLPERFNSTSSPQGTSIVNPDLNSVSRVE